jgi:NAD(P)-dependent dehydrogenase (short-subunit alcohol dehydrogenase family)
VLEGQVAWVTGGGRGIGRATALALAEQGARVALASRTPAELARVAADLTSRGARAMVLPLDVTRWSAVQSAAREIQRELGAVDILVNNAGLLEPLGRLWETDPLQWTRLIDVNLGGAYHCMRAVLPDMVERGRGVVLNVSSGAATIVSPGWSAYAASKAGLDHLTRNLAAELEGTKVRAYTLHPGIVDTRMQDILRGATPRQIPADRRQFFVDLKEAGQLLSPDVPARVMAWMASAGCDLESGTMIDLHTQTEFIARADRELFKPRA